MQKLHQDPFFFMVDHWETKLLKWYDFDPTGEYQPNLTYRPVGIQLGLGGLSINSLP